VRWFVRASVDIAWAPDPKAEVEVIVLPREGRYALEAGGGYRSPAQPKPIRHDLGPSALAGRTRQSKPHMGLGTGLVILGAGVAFLWSGWPAYIVTPIVALVVGSGLVDARLRQMARRALGPPHVELDRGESHPSGTIIARAMLQPADDVEVTEVSATLACKENAVSGGGSSATTHNRIVAANLVSLVRVRNEPGDSSHIYEGTLTLPASAPPSFGSPSNDVTWSVEFSIEATSPAGAHKITEELVLSVQPA
jgi:hypothetical protein